MICLRLRLVFVKLPQRHGDRGGSDVACFARDQIAQFLFGLPFVHLGRQGDRFLKSVGAGMVGDSYAAMAELLNRREGQLKPAKSASSPRARMAEKLLPN